MRRIFLSTFIACIIGFTGAETN